MKRVLYIDDEADTDKMESKFDVMREEGIRLVKVARVADAIPAIRKHSGEIGLIVLDLIMPPEEFYPLEETNGGTTTGLRLLEDIRKEFADIPIMIVSIRRMNVASDHITRYKIAEFMEKPVETLDLVAAIKRHAR